MADEEALTELTYEQLVAELNAIRDRRAKARERPKVEKAENGEKKVAAKKKEGKVSVSDAAWDLLNDDAPAGESADDLLDDMTK